MTEEEFSQIDRYISKEKQISNQTPWVVINHPNRVESIIQLVDGNIIETEFSFRGSVNNNVRSLDESWGELKLFFKNKSNQKIWISRISYNPQHNHTNAKLDGFDWSLQSLKKGVCLLYKWEQRKQSLMLGRGEENAPATPLPEVKNFETFINTFKEYLNIKGNIKLPELSQEMPLFTNGE